MSPLLLLACFGRPTPHSPEPAAVVAVQSVLPVSGPVRSEGEATVFGAPDWRVVAVTAGGAIRSSEQRGMQLVRTDGAHTDWLPVAAGTCQPTQAARIVFCDRRDYVDLETGQVLASHPWTPNTPQTSAVLPDGWIAHIEGSALRVRNAFGGGSDTVELPTPPTGIAALPGGRLQVSAGEDGGIFLMLDGHLGQVSRGPGRGGERWGTQYTERGAGALFNEGEVLFQVGNAGRSAFIDHVYRVGQMRVSGDSTQFAAVLEFDHPETGYERRVQWYRVHPYHFELIAERPLDRGDWLYPTPHGVVLVEWLDGDLHIEGPGGTLAVLEDLPQSMHPQVSGDGALWHLGEYGTTLDPLTWQVSGPRLANPGRSLRVVQTRGPWRVTWDGETNALWRDGVFVRALDTRSLGGRPGGFSADGDRLLVGTRVVETQSGELLYDLGDWLQDDDPELALHPDGETVLVFSEGADADQISRARLSDGEPLWSTPIPRRKANVVTTLALSDNAQTLAVSRWQRDLSLIDLETGALQSTHRIAGIQEVAWGPAGELALQTAPFTGGTGTYVLQKGRVRRVEERTATYVDFDPQGRLVMAFQRWGEHPGSIERLDLESGALQTMALPVSLQGLEAHGDHVLLSARWTSAVWSVPWP